MWGSRRSTGVTVPTIDPTDGDPAGAALLADLRRRDWRAASDFLRTVSDPDDLSFYLDVAATVQGLQAWIGEWIDAEPGSGLPVLVRGAHAINWAWLARGNARAKNTSAAQFRMFARRLELAEDCLAEAARRNPADPNPWALMITTSIGSGLGVAESHRRFGEAVARYRWHATAHHAFFNQLCAKWGGSHEQMHAFAAQTAATAPPGSPLGVLVADAHLERWLELPEDEDLAYLRQPAVLADLHAAANVSVRHPAYRPRPGWPGTHNTFAMAFWLADDHAAAADLFDVLGDRVTNWPWRYLSSAPAERFAQARAESYARRAAGSSSRA